MMNKFKIEKTSFPKQTDPDFIKETKDWGRAVGVAIQGQWFYRNSGNSRYYNFKNEIHRRRLYARGEQPIGKYKKSLAINGDLSHLNLNWSNVPIVPKFVDLVANGMSERKFEIKASAVDPISILDRQKYKKTIERDMVSRPLLENALSNANIDAFNIPPDSIPENEEELDVFMELGYKPKIELAVELGVKSIFEDNDFNNSIKKRLDRDSIESGISVVKQEYDKEKGVKLSYVDPEDFIWSYTDDPYFKDCYYFGEIKRVNVSELHRLYPHLTSEELKKISDSGVYWDVYNSLNGVNNYETYDGFQDSKAAVLYFNFKTTRNRVYKKKLMSGGGYKMIEKDERFNPPKDMDGDYEKVCWVEEVWYDGVMVLGSNIMLKWEVSSNQLRNKNNTNRVYPTYYPIAPKLYNGSIESLVSRMIPFADLIQLIHLKLQQIQMRMLPDGVYIDVDGVNELDLGNGQVYNPTEALNMFLQTGSVIGRGLTAEGEYNQGSIPIREINTSGGGQKIQSLIASYNHYLQMIRDVTGLNEARDGSAPDKYALVGLQKLASYNSNVATRHVLDSGIYITKKLAEATVLRLAEALDNKDVKKDFVNRLGIKNTDVLDELDVLSTRDLSIYIDLLPDEEEKEKIELNIQQELKNGTLWVEDAIDIRNVSNVKLANQVLKIKKKKRIKEIQNQKKLDVERQTQSNIDSSNAAAQAKAELSKIETESKVIINNNLSENEINKLREEARLKEYLMEKEFKYKLELTKMQMDTIYDKENNKEDRKDKRVDKQSTQQSILIKQRKDNTPPVDFEDKERSGINLDSLKKFESSGNDIIGGGIGLEQFSVK